MNQFRRGKVDPATRNALLEAGTPAATFTNVAERGQELRALLTIAFASPDFQRR